MSDQAFTVSAQEVGDRFAGVGFGGIVAADVGRQVGRLESLDLDRVLRGESFSDAAAIEFLEGEQAKRIADPTDERAIGRVIGGLADVGVEELFGAGGFGGREVAAAVRRNGIGEMWLVVVQGDGAFGRAL